MMNRLTPWTATLPALLLTLPMVSFAGEFDLKRTEQIMTQLIERSMAERGIASVSVALVKDNEIVWKAAFGYSNVRTKTLATPDTIYSTGSTFKSVTATAIMQLVEKGVIELDSPINPYLGRSRVQDRLQSEDPVTFEHILSHWSGLISGAETQPIWGRTLPKTMDEFTSDLYTVRPVEKKWEYNNFAYGTAGLLIEKISDQEYEEYILEHILQPLGVTTPHPVYPSPDMVEMMALPYAAGGPKGLPKPEVQVHFDVYPAGDIYLTAEDMARYLGAHLNNGVFNGERILSEESIKDMHTNRFGGDYSLGFWVEEDKKTGHTIIQHGGAINGQRSMLRGDVDAKVGIYYMTNSDVSIPIDEPALQLLRGEDYELPPARADLAKTVAAKTLQQYIGTYSSPEGITLTFKNDGDALYTEIGDVRWDLIPESQSSFYHPAYDSVISFVDVKKGVAQAIELEINLREYRATRD